MLALMEEHSFATLRDWILSGDSLHILYVTVSAKTSLVRTKIYIYFFGPAYSYTQ